MAPFDKSLTTASLFCHLSYNTFEILILTLKNIVTLKSGLGVAHPANLCTICTTLK